MDGTRLKPICETSHVVSHLPPPHSSMMSWEEHVLEIRQNRLASKLYPFLSV